MPVVDAELEGPVDEPPKLENADAVTLKVMGVSVRVPRLTRDPDVTNGRMLTPIHTPARRIKLAELADVTKLDGRSDPGFSKATIIVTGSYDTDVDPRELLAASVEIEPAENLLAGAVTAVNPLAINGVTVTPIADTRMKFKGYTNEFGFQVAATPALGTAAVAEGYYIGPRFYAHTVELDAGTPMLPNQPPVSLTRVRTRSRPGGPATVDIRGGVDFNALPGVNLNQFQVAIRRMIVDPLDPGTFSDGNLIGVVRATRDVAFPRFGLWRLSGLLVQPPEGANAGEPFPLTAPRFVQVFPFVPDVTPSQTASGEADVRF